MYLSTYTTDSTPGCSGEGSRGRGDSQRTNYCIPTEAEIGRERETGALFE